MDPYRHVDYDALEKELDAIGDRMGLPQGPESSSDPGRKTLREGFLALFKSAAEKMDDQFAQETNTYKLYARNEMERAYEYADQIEDMAGEKAQSIGQNRELKRELRSENRDARREAQEMRDIYEAYSEGLLGLQLTELNKNLSKQLRQIIDEVQEAKKFSIPEANTRQVAQTSLNHTDHENIILEEFLANESADQPEPFVLSDVNADGSTQREAELAAIMAQQVADMNLIASGNPKLEINTNLSQSIRDGLQEVQNTFAEYRTFQDQQPTILANLRAKIRKLQDIGREKDPENPAFLASPTASPIYPESSEANQVSVASDFFNYPKVHEVLGISEEDLMFYPEKEQPAFILEQAKSFLESEPVPKATLDAKILRLERKRQKELKTAQNDYEAKTEKLQAELADSQKILSNLKEDKGLCESSTVSSLRKIDDLEVTIAELQRNIVDLQKEKDAYETLATSSSEKARTLEIEFSKSEATIDGLRNEVAHLQEQLTKEKNSRGISAALSLQTTSDLQRRLASVENDFDNLKTQTHSLKCRVEDKEGHIQSQTEELGKIQAVIINNSASLIELRKQIEEQKSMKDAQLKTPSPHQAKTQLDKEAYEPATKDLAKARSRTVNVKKIHRSNSFKVAETQNELDVAKEQCEDAVESLPVTKQQRTSIQYQHTKDLGEFNYFKKELHPTRADNESMDHRLTQAQKLLASAEKNYEISIHQRDEATDRLSVIQKDRSYFSHKLGEATGKLESVENIQIIDNLRQLKELLAASQDEPIANIHEAEKKLAVIEGKCNFAASELKAIEEKLKALDMAGVSLSVCKLSEVKKSLSTCEEAHDAAFHDCTKAKNDLGIILSACKTAEGGLDDLQVTSNPLASPSTSVSRYVPAPRPPLTPVAQRDIPAWREIICDELKHLWHSLLVYASLAIYVLEWFMWLAQPSLSAPKFKLLFIKHVDFSKIRLSLSLQIIPFIIFFSNIIWAAHKERTMWLSSNAVAGRYMRELAMTENIPFSCLWGGMDYRMVPIYSAYSAFSGRLMP
ncbi:chromosome segregation protein SMC [Ceratocystis platani]|uniref:Chromosome segregation protein SMC n=1 Tax=Ceratocystis fimbriata f. sp. platani TaxID=88771 RepID=A0A0F8BSG7_CERFI|nr:chromosome segregation protein SMC [Ceratocystis platani]